MKLTELRVAEFLDETASKSPAPGGGSVSALAGALSAALAEMVANLSMGEKFAAVEAQMHSAAERAQALRQELQTCIQRDTDGFDAYMAALHLPKETPEQKETRRQAMQQALKTAALIPLETAATAAKLFAVAETVLCMGNPNAASDALVAAMLARTAVYGALLNVRINLDGIRDEAFCKELESKVQALRREAAEQESKILKLSPLSDNFG